VETDHVQDPQAKTAHIRKHMLDRDGIRDFTSEVPGTRLFGIRHHVPAHRGRLAVPSHGYLATDNRDQGVEMSKHKAFSINCGMDVYFCDPHSPWQRGRNENTNGLLRQD